MKKNILPALIIVLAALCATSCRKDSDTLFTGHIERVNSMAKTELAVNDSVFWCSGDKVSINGATYTASPISNRSTKADLIPEGAHAALVNGKFRAYYPASLYNDGHPELPAVQVYEAGRISNLPMYAECEYNDENTVDLSFHNICSVIEITISGNADDHIGAIEISSDNPLWGNFEVRGDSAYITGATTEANNTVILDCNNTTLSNAGTKFWVAIPAGQHNLSFKVLKNDFKSGDERKTSHPVQVRANSIYPISWTPSFDSLTRGIAPVTGPTGRSWCEWVQLWGNGPRWAMFNVGSTINSYGALQDGTDPTEGSARWYNTANVGGLYTWHNPNLNGRTTTWNENVPYAISDVAQTLWGSNWREPDLTELQKLGNLVIIKYNDTCNLEGATTRWARCDGHNKQYVPGCTLAGFKVFGIGDYSQNSIFLPLSGIYWFEYTNVWNTSIDNNGVSCAYWSSFDEDDIPFMLYINPEEDNSNTRVIMYENDYQIGYSVRAVLR